jgi:flagellar FliL protein
MPEESPQAEAASAAPAAAPAAKGGRRLILVVVALVVVLGGGGAGWFFVLGPGAHKADAKEATPPPVEPAVGALAPLDPFIANLADEDGKRYLKATIQVEFFAAQLPEGWNSRLPQIRDLLLTLFTSKTFAEVRTAQGKAVLRDEIINRVNRALKEDQVKAVYFTEFIVQ